MLIRLSRQIFRLYWQILIVQSILTILITLIYFEKALGDITDYLELHLDGCNSLGRDTSTSKNRPRTETGEKAKGTKRLPPDAWVTIATIVYHFLHSCREPHFSLYIVLAVLPSVPREH